MTQLEVIKKFMSSLDSGVEDGITALNNAVKACSSFKTAQAAINKMISDCKKAGNSKTFLEESCGIFLNNDDTGAITGLDAGGDYVKNAEDIVPEETKAVYPKKNYFTKEGLTVKTPKPSTLKGDKKITLQGLYSWWVEESLKLIEESFGYSFKDTDAYTNTIDLKFYSKKNSGTLAYVSSAGDHEDVELEMYINMGIFKNLIKSNKNGKAKNDDEYLDRTIAHELTHAIMAAKVDSYNNYETGLPISITEGLAELVHGIDDERFDEIQELAGNSTKLKKYLNTTKYEATDTYDYAAGYMFLRYLAMQGANEVPWLNYDDEQILTGTSAKDTIRNFGSDVEINGGKGNDYLVSYYGYENNENKKIFAENVTLNGGAGVDTFYGSSDNIYFIGGAGNDSIFSYSDNATIYSGAGNDTIEINLDAKVEKNIIRYGSGDGKDVVYGFDSDDVLKITKGSHKITTSGNDVIVKVGSGSVKLKNAVGQEITIIDSKGTTKVYGASSADLLTEDNFSTADNLSAIVQNDLTPTFFGKIETQNFENLKSEDNLITYVNEK